MLMVYQTKFTATSCKGIVSVIVFFPSSLIKKKKANLQSSAMKQRGDATYKNLCGVVVVVLHISLLSKHTYPS